MASGANNTTVVVPAKSAAVAAAAKGGKKPLTGPLASSKEEADQLPLIAKIINHVLTPGSSLSGVMLIFFNVIVFMLFTIWLMFVYVMPTSWIVWTFGFLGAGLAASTNYLLYMILFVVEEPKQEEDGEENKAEDSEKKEGEEEASGPKAIEEAAAATAEEEKDEEPAPAAPKDSSVSAGNREGSLRKRKAKKEN